MPLISGATTATAGMIPIASAPNIGAWSAPSALTFTGQAQGAVLYRNATGWVALPPGTVGQVLTSGGAGANPSWGSGASTLVSIADNTSAAYQILEGANSYYRIDTNNLNEQIVHGNSTSGGPGPLHWFIGSSVFIDQLNQSSGSSIMFYARAGTHTTLPASTEVRDVYFDLSRTVQFSTGAKTSQRAFDIEAPTYSAVGATTITDAATVAISGAPVAGANMTLTRSNALLIGVPASTTAAPNVSIGFRNGNGSAAFAASLTYTISSGIGYLQTSGGILSSPDNGTGGGGGEAFGIGTRVTGANAVAMGRNCTGSGSGSFAAGTTCTSGGAQSLALGANASSAGSRAISISTDGGTVAHANSIAIGAGLSSTADNQCSIWCDTAILGRGDTGNAVSLTNVTLRLTNASSTSTTNATGGTLTIVPGRPTGNGAGGHFVVQTAAPGSSGSTLQTAYDRLRVRDTGEVLLNGQPNAQAVQVSSVTQVVTLGSGTAVTSTIAVPAGALVLFVSARVTTVITGPAAWRYGLTGDATMNRYGANISTALNTTNRGADTTTGIRTAGAGTVTVEIQPEDGITAFTGGAVRLTIFYIESIVPTS